MKWPIHSSLEPETPSWVGQWPRLTYIGPAVLEKIHVSQSASPDAGWNCQSTDEGIQIFPHFFPYGVVVVCFASQLLLITQLFPFSFWQFHRHRDTHTHTYLSEVSYLRVLKHLSQFLTFLTSHSYSVYELANNSCHRRRRNGFLCTHWGKVNFKFWNEIRYEKVPFSPKIVHDILDFQFFFFTSLY